MCLCVCVCERERECVCVCVFERAHVVCVSVFVPSEVSDEMSSITWGIETQEAKTSESFCAKKIQSVFFGSPFSIIFVEVLFGGLYYKPTRICNND